ncbi:hypothetical protein H4Q26_004173 [Puccinia striiformis f. sp. tritici PST-130]|nr:hypothetical protein H4Q26_004173 [Puccinia striiformis f. sp. tritici PST-130]
MCLQTTVNTAPKEQIKANPNPQWQKLLDQILTNHKVKARKEQTENAKPAQPEREEPGGCTRLHKEKETEMEAD